MAPPKAPLQVRFALAPDARATSGPKRPQHEHSYISTPSQVHPHNTIVGKMSSQNQNKNSTLPGLVAIALVIRSKDGPRFIYHYPAVPATKAPKRDTRFGTELDDEVEVEDDEEGDDSDLEDGGYQIHQSIGGLSMNEKATRKDRSTEGFDDDHFDGPDGEHIVPWEHVSEFLTTDLESILTPSRAFNKKKFELYLDPLFFVTYPMHIREDGFWKKRKPKKTKKAKESSEPGEVKSSEGGNEDAKAPDMNDGDEHGGMTMFNVVFILNLPRDEEDERISEIYEHIIKKFNKVLSHAQASSDYVWKESELILSMKEKAREERRPMSWLWNQIMIKSTLAAAINDLYTAISTNRIATVQLATTPPLDISLQIPVPAFLTSLPTATERSLPGLLLTTANPMVDEEGNLDTSYINKHFALLLLDDEEKIINNIQTDDNELSGPLLECIHICKPNLSFLQVAQQHSVELPDLLILAQHLIHWRRAIAIPPLHARETYIVSPNCDSRELPAASVAWKKTFPLAPTLSGFLANLSAAPRPYKTFFPSKNHAAKYLDMLGWLIRGGWVTQLRTFAWIQVWPEIIYEVEYQLKKEALEKRVKFATSSESANSTEESESDKDKETDSSGPLTTEQAAEHARLERVALKAAAEAATDAAEFAKLPLPVATDHPSINHAAHLTDQPYYIIVDPHKVSHEESLYIASIGSRIKDPKAREWWPKFTKYFNGNEALEDIALIEGLKRKELWQILLQYQEHVMVVKHW